MNTDIFYIDDSRALNSSSILSHNISSLFGQDIYFYVFFFTNLLRIVYGVVFLTFNFRYYINNCYHNYYVKQSIHYAGSGSIYSSLLKYPARKMENKARFLIQFSWHASAQKQTCLWPSILF